MCARRRFAIAAVCCALAACSADAPSTVTGQFTTRYLTDSGEIAMPADLSAYEVFALVPNGDGYDEYPGETLADGRFEIPDVPAGEFVLEYRRPSFALARRETERELAYSGALLGRPDLVLPTSNETRLGLQVDGLRPWQTADALMLFSSNTDMLVNVHQLYPAEPPDPGATAIAGPDLWYTSHPLIDAAKGDRVLAYQHSTREEAGMRYGAIVRAGELEPFTMIDGGATAASGALSDPPEDVLDIAWDASAGPGWREHVFPSAAFRGGAIHATAVPDTSAFGCGNGTPALVSLPLDPSNATSAASLPFADPLPARWERVVCVGLTYDVEFPSLDWPVSGGFTTMMPLDEIQPGEPLSLAQGPIRNPTIAGVSAFANLGNVGETPLLAWDPPEDGEPDYYSISLYRPIDRYGWADYERLAWFRTTEPSFTIPPEILASGEKYFARIYAIRDDGRHYAHAVTVTGMFER